MHPMERIIVLLALCRSRFIVFLTAAVALLCAALVANRLAHAQSTKAAATGPIAMSSACATS